MKSAYELAMERLEQQSPSGPALTDEQKQTLANLNEKYEAKIAQAKIMAEQEIKQAAGDWPAIEKIQARLREEIDQLESERESKKQQIREKK